MTELRLLTGDCERLKAGKFHDRCGCHFLQLPRFFALT
jgi:hypothetical protein